MLYTRVYNIINQRRGLDFTRILVILNIKDKKKSFKIKLINEK